MRNVVITLLLTLTLPALANPGFRIHPFAEAVASVRNGEDIAQTLTRDMGWNQRLRNTLGKPELDLWQLSQPTTATQWLLAAPGSERGFLRLIEFSNVAQQPVRPFDQAWDSGGLFDINVRTHDLNAVYELLKASGWQADSEPVHIRLPGFEQKQWLPRTADGLRISPIEAVAPRPQRKPSANSALLSEAFNATQVVADLDAAAAFYRDVLGFELVMDSPDTRLEPGPNVFGLPYNLLTDLTLPFVVLSADGSRDGTLELIQFRDAKGRDFSHNASPPNLGMLALRFPVTGLQELYQHLRQQEVEIITPPITITLQPHGLVQIFAVRGPEGMWLEFFE